MRLCIVGAGGVLGAKLVEQALARSAQPIYAFTHGRIPAISAASSPRVLWHPLDLTDEPAVSQALYQARPDIVINSAALTNVDACELRQRDALHINGSGPRHLAQVCTQLGAGLVQVSTDYVFPGDDEQPGPYDETAAARPVNYYGVSKLQGEQSVIETCTNRVPWLIARTALVYGHVPGGRTNFVRWLVGELRAGRRVKIVNDQVNTPTLADDLAAVLLHLVDRRAQGIIHVTGPDLLTRDAWSRVIAAYYGLNEHLIDVLPTVQLNQPAQRPLRSGLRSIRHSEWDAVGVRGVHAGLEALQLAER